MQYKIYIVEDDSSIRNLLNDYISKFGFCVRLAVNFEKILSEFSSFMPDLILMDINLPKFDGLYWCRQIRALSSVPIILISTRDSGMDRIMTMGNGADDYITRPFYSEVVLNKIKNQIRRAYGEYAASTDIHVIKLDGLEFSPERLELKFKERTATLSKKEGMLLESLLTRYPNVVSREYLLEKMLDTPTIMGENNLNVNVTRLRRRLQELQIDHGIETVRGIGYRFNKSW